MPITQSVIIQPRPNVRQINYLAKTFADFRQNLIEFSKSYYPNTYADFNEASPGMMFIEMASYLGDVLSFYIDNQFKENLLAYAEQPENIITLAQFLGYRPKLIAPSSTEAELSISVPSVLSDGEWIPNPKYLPQIGIGTICSTNDQKSIRFRLAEVVDFRDILPEDYTANEVTAEQIPVSFMVTKLCKLVAGSEKTISVGFGSAQKFSSTLLPNENIIGIDEVVDSDGNNWYEVDYLAQDVIMDDVQLTANSEDGKMPQSGLRLRKVPRRFVTRITRENRMQMVFGSGESNAAELDVLVDSRQIATSQYGNTIAASVGNVAINNLNFLNSNAYGLSPANTTLTIKYIVGGGVETNAPTNTITSVETLVVDTDTTGYTPSEAAVFAATTQTLSVTNPNPASGGGTGDSIDEIRENALMFFNAQNRVVTNDDYVVRSYSLPSKYGKIARAYALRDEQLNSILAFQGDKFIETSVRPTAINLYTLGYDQNGNLTTLNTITKENLARYLDQYRMLTDDINIVDAFVVNIGVRFNVTVFKNYNLRDVLARSIDAVQTFFNIDNWVINQPIILSDLKYAIGSVDGVQTITNVEITNKYQFKDGSDYQNYRYDISDATVNGVVYPSLDPCIFELKYPQTDIIGGATQ